MHSRLLGGRERESESVLACTDAIRVTRAVKGRRRWPRGKRSGRKGKGNRRKEREGGGLIWAVEFSSKDWIPIRPDFPSFLENILLTAHLYVKIRLRGCEVTVYLAQKFLNLNEFQNDLGSSKCGGSMCMPWKDPKTTVEWVCCRVTHKILC